MEMGAKVAFIVPDGKTTSYVHERTKVPFTSICADRGASYKSSIAIDVATLVSQVACPHAVDNTKAVKDIAGTRIDQALIGSCTNGRLEDLEIAARILDGRTIDKHVRLLVIPASRRVYLEALHKGYIEVFIKAGGLVLNPGCGPCLGAHQGLLAPGEACVATTNRNFRGRMGSPESSVYLASPATVAFSALRGEITEPC
jgi:homoaconitase/3-isopropylmalate dehydratase large subunit